jgi:hypothetical protein
VEAVACCWLTRRRSRPTLAATIDAKVAGGEARGRRLSARVVIRSWENMELTKPELRALRQIRGGGWDPGRRFAVGVACVLFATAAFLFVWDGPAAADRLGGMLLMGAGWMYTQQTLMSLARKLDQRLRDEQIPV